MIALQTFAIIVVPGSESAMTHIKGWRGVYVGNNLILEGCTYHKSADITLYLTGNNLSPSNAESHERKQNCIQTLSEIWPTGLSCPGQKLATMEHWSLEEKNRQLNKVAIP